MGKQGARELELREMRERRSAKRMHGIDPHKFKHVITEELTEEDALRRCRGIPGQRLRVPPHPVDGPIGDGVALTSMEHPRGPSSAPAKTSRGGVESRHAREAKSGQARNLTPAPKGPRIPTAGVAPGPRETKRKSGRPLAKDRDKTIEAAKPWIAEGLSRATWYRRQAEKRK